MEYGCSSVKTEKLVAAIWLRLSDTCSSPSQLVEELLSRSFHLHSSSTNDTDRALTWLRFRQLQDFTFDNWHEYTFPIQTNTVDPIACKTPCLIFVFSDSILIITHTPTHNKNLKNPKIKPYLEYLVFSN